MATFLNAVPWDAEASSLRNVTPILFGGDVAGRLRNVLSISIEQRLGEGDNCVIAIGHTEVDTDKAVPIIIVEAAYLDRIRSVRSDDYLCHEMPFRVSRGDRTIADDGAVASQGLNNRDRAAGGLGA